MLSLNYIEVNLLIEELNLDGSYLQKVHQINQSEILFQFYKKRSQLVLFIIKNNINCFYQIQAKKYSSPKQCLRFCQLLRSRITGFQLVSFTQIQNDRILKLEFAKNNEVYFLWIRLWTNHSNMILTTEKNIIIDCLYRKSSRDEISGKYWQVKEKIFDKRSYKSRFIKDKSYSQQVEESINKQEDLSTDSRESYLKNILKKQSYYQKIFKEIENQNPLDESKQYKNWADLLLSSNQIQLKSKSSNINIHDHNTNKVIQIPIPADKEFNFSQLAELYYKKYKKLKEASKFIEQRKKEISESLQFVNKAYSELLNPDSDLKNFKEIYHSLLVDEKKKNFLKTSPKEDTTYLSHGFAIFLGRNSQENDELLRKKAKGNDYWLHLRDFPGSYVFIRAQKSKTIPLEVFLDAAHLALHYSKKKKLIKADFYYTQVKYLRRIQNAKLGLVIPTKEKNLSINFDEKRLKRLLDQKSY